MYDKEKNTKVDAIIPKELDIILKASANKNCRTKSQEICYILMQYFAHKNKDIKGVITNVYEMDRT